MIAKRYWFWVIVSFSILVVVWPAGQITGKTGLCEKEKEIIKSDELFSAPGETGLSAKDKEDDSNLVTSEQLALSCKRVKVNNKEILRGLEGVYVWVGNINPLAERYGMTRKALRTDTELQLRQYGIKALTAKEIASTPGAPWLRIEMSIGIGGEGPFNVISMRVGLVESVLLLREPKRICLGACTWQRGGLVGIGGAGIMDIRGYVRDLVNAFINDYLAANLTDKLAAPKQQIR